MNIVLTQKDADFILKYIRMDAKRVDDRFKTLEENEHNLLKSCEQLNKFEPETASMVTEFAKKLGSDVRSDLEELKSDFTRCIELLTIGSEVDK